MTKIKYYIKKWLHDKLDWGFRQRAEGLSFKGIGGDSFQSTYLCQFCDRELVQDSQMNWFHLSTPQSK